MSGQVGEAGRDGRKFSREEFLKVEGQGQEEDSEARVLGREDEAQGGRFREGEKLQEGGRAGGREGIGLRSNRMEGRRLA